MKKKLSTLLLILCVVFTLGVVSPSTKAKAATTCTGLSYNASTYNLLLEYAHRGSNSLNTTYSYISTGNIYNTCIYPSSRYSDKAKVLQYALSEYGYIISIDGYYGECTTTAVKAYQKSKDLYPDGIAGPATLNSLIWNLKLKGKLRY